MIDNRVLGKLNTDDADRDLEQIDIRDCLNLVPQVGGKSNSTRRVSLDGMIKKTSGVHGTTFSLPSGTNITVGQFEDKSTSRIFFFNYNSYNNHGVYVYVPEINTIASLIESSVLNFNSNTVISGAGAIDDTLVFTDGENQIRSINVQFALNTSNNNTTGSTASLDFIETRKWQVVFDRVNIIDEPITLTFNYADGSTKLVALTTLTSNIDSDLDNWVLEINTDIEAGIAERCGDTIEITENWKRVAQINSIVSSNSEVLIASPLNFFTDWTDRNINLINQPPQCEPTFSFEDDLTRGLNFINDKPFQFRTRYVYYDKTESSLSPISGIAFSKNCDDSQPLKGNVIEITFHPQPFTTFESSMIKQVELYFRIGNTGNWFKAQTLSRDEYFTGKYRFYNDGNYIPLGDLDSNKLFDSIPDKSNSLTILKNRLFIGGITEGRETPCLEASLDVTIDDAPAEPETWVIEGYLRIANSYNWSSNPLASQTNLALGRSNQFVWVDNPSDLPQFGGVSVGYVSNDKITTVGSKYKQYIPQGGFTIFLAGTDYKATSKHYYNSDGTLNPDLSVSASPPVYTFNGDIRDDVMKEDKALHYFRIEGVKPGRYIMRVASHLVYDGVVPDDISSYVGDFYQINKTNKWQETSTHLRTIAEPVTNVSTLGVTIPLNDNWKYPLGPQEMYLELGAEGGTYSITDSVIVVDDLTDPNSFSGGGITGFKKAGAFDAYIVDTAGGSDASSFIQSSVLAGCDIKLREIQTLPPLFPPISLTTPFQSDHNGYFYSSYRYPEIDIYGSFNTHFRLVDIYFNGYEVCTYELAGATNQSQIIYGFSQFGEDTGYNIGDVYSGNVVNGDYNSKALFWTKEFFAVSDAQGTKQAIISAKSTEIRTKARTQLTGVLKDVNGVPISNALIVATGSNEVRKTSSDGSYSLTIYTTAINIASTTVIYSAGLSSCLVDSDPLSSDKELVLNLPISASDYNNIDSNNWYDIGLTTFGTVKDLAKSTFLKRGGIYKYGVVYQDDYLRSALVSTQDDLKVKIPFYTEDLYDFFPNNYPVPNTFKYGDPTIEWQIKSTPPSWATRYKWVRTKNSAYNNYLHWVANEIAYIKSYDVVNETPTSTTYADGDATEIHISLENILTYKGEVSNSQLGYTWTQGDRIVLIKNNGTYYTDYLDYEVTGQRGNAVTIKNIASLDELKEGLQFHIYTPKLQVEDDIYYEISGCYEIENGLHKGQTQDQTSTLPASGYFTTGDTYKISRRIPTKNATVSNTLDSEYITDAITTKDSDIGRPNIENNEYKTEFRFGTVRFSSPYVQGSFVNGIKTFDALDEEILPYERGIIRKMVGTTNTILVIHETEATTLYITESFLHTAEGNDILTKVDKVIGDENLLKGEFGTLNPESVVEFDDSIYWWDATKSEPIRYSNNGLTPLAFNLGVKGLFLDIEKVRKAYKVANKSSVSRVYGGYDPVKNLFMISFADMGDGNTNTIAFSEDSKYWVTRLSFVPEHYTKLSNELFSFNNGELWQHDIDTDNPNTFYGTHYDSSFTIISNADNEIEKIFRNLSISSNKLWDVTEITNRDGQQSSLVKNSFVQRDNMYYSDILRDENTSVDTLLPNQTPRLHGHVMRSQIMQFKFVTDEEGKIYVENVFVGYQYSPGHLIDNSK